MTLSALGDSLGTRRAGTVAPQSCPNPAPPFDPFDGYVAWASPADSNSGVNAWLREQLDFTTTMDREQFALIASSTLRVNDRAYVVENWHPQDPTLEAGAPVSGGGGSNRIGVESSIGAGTFDGPVTLEDRSIGGFIQATDQITVRNQTSYSGLSSWHFVEQPPIDLSFAFSTLKMSDVMLEPGELIDFAQLFRNRPHRDVIIPRVELKANSQATLECGQVYQFGQLIMHPDSELRVEGDCGPTRVFVASSLSIKGRVLGVANATESKIFFGYLGTGTADLGAGADGVYVAPNTMLNMVGGDDGPYWGAYYARSIELHQGAKVIHTPFLQSWSP